MRYSVAVLYVYLYEFTDDIAVYLSHTFLVTRGLHRMTFSDVVLRLRYPFHSRSTWNKFEYRFEPFDQS